MPPAAEHLAIHFQRLEHLVVQGPGADAVTAMERQAADLEASLPEPGALPLNRLGERFGLSAFQRDALLLLASAELYPALAARARLTDGGGDRAVGGAGVRPARRDVLRALAPGADESVWHVAELLPGAALVDAGLVREAPGGGLTVPAHWLGFLRGVRWLGVPERVAARVQPDVAWEQVVLDPVTRSNLDWLGGRLLHARPEDEPLERSESLALPRGAAVLLLGEPGCGRTLAARAVATRHGRALLVVDGPLLAALPEHPSGGRLDALERLAQQAQVFDELLLVRDGDELAAAAPELARLLGREIAGRRLLAFVTARDATPLDPALDAVTVYRAPIPPPGPDARRELLQVNAPGRLVLGPEVDLTRLARFPLTGRQLAKGLALAARLADEGAAVGHAELDALLAMQSVSGASLDRPTGVAPRLAQLVLAPETRDQLQQIVRAAQVRRKVLDEWGFGRLIHRGLGLVCLFDGEPGTGKTLAAEVIAAEAGLTLKRVDVGTVVDKYIGETEKNLARIFAQADPAREVLLFDEADALFAKRTSIQRSTDRYSNMEINALLQLVERYEGIVCLTTNLEESMDPAFERRIMYKVTFPLPDESMRATLWLRHLPAEAPYGDDLDVDLLAERYPLAGGAIKNAVLRAAYAAASEDQPLSQRHLAAAARAEAVAAGMLVREG
jgi:AAA+ superfamily predicted ATPase